MVRTALNLSAFCRDVSSFSLIFTGLYSLFNSDKISLVSIETVFNLACGLFRSLIVSEKYRLAYATYKEEIF